MKRQTRPERPVTYEQLKEQERLILDATELIFQCMEEQNVSKAELARRVGRSRAYLTQLLSGSRNMTLRTLADLASAFDCRIEMSTRSRAGAQVPRPTVVQLPPGDVHRERLRWHGTAADRWHPEFASTRTDLSQGRRLQFVG
jgi:transcriptional regulator with XRE-family HTH domain